MKGLRKTWNHLKNTEKLITFDADKDIKSTFLRYLAKLFTELGSTIGISCILIILYFVSGKDILYILLPIYLFQLAIVEGIKLLFKRPRPAGGWGKNLFGLKTSSGSFPSGHTSNIFTLAFLLTNYYRTDLLVTTLIFTLAGGIAFTRIVLGRHYLVDIIGGALIGLALSVAGALLLPKLLVYVL